MSGLTIRGRPLSADDLALIRGMAARAGQTRCAISRAVCARLGWVQANGRPWDMACRYLLRRLEQQGLLTLPPPRVMPVRSGPPALSAAGDPQAPVTAPVGQLGPLRWARVDGTPLARLWDEYIHRYHYLGWGTLVGPHLRYLIGYEGGWLAAMGFAGAAWQLAPRDRWIGWTAAQRQARLPLVVNQTRYLILPWVRSPNLASHLLALAARRLVRDWERTYRCRPLLLETFVDARRYPGTCYRAANWLHLGSSQGRGKLDRAHMQALPVKDIFVYPLHPRAREHLCAP
jgi:hypothetical protein